MKTGNGKGIPPHWLYQDPQSLISGGFSATWGDYLFNP
jgi:hypothetical protein